MSRIERDIEGYLLANLSCQSCSSCFAPLSHRALAAALGQSIGEEGGAEGARDLRIGLRLQRL